LKNNILLHIGTPKTGTSAIQKFLLENNTLLERQGYIYPLHSIDDNGIASGNGAQLIHLMKIGQKNKAKNYLNSLMNKYKNKTIILSSENFYHEPNLTKKLVENAKIIVYIREQSEQIRADYNQSIKRHGQIYFFDKALNVALTNNYALYDFSLLHYWSKLYGHNNIQIKIYDRKKFKNNNIINDFMETLGIQKNISLLNLQQNRINVSYYEDVLRFKLWFNRLIYNNKKYENFDKIMDLALQNYSQYLVKKNIIDYSPYTNEELKKIRLLYAKGNNQICKVFFNKKSTNLFTYHSNNSTYYPYPGLKEEAIIKIAFYLKKNYKETYFLLYNIIVSLRDSADFMQKEAVNKLSPILNIERN